MRNTFLWLIVFSLVIVACSSPTPNTLPANQTVSQPANSPVAPPTSSPAAPTPSPMPGKPPQGRPQAGPFVHQIQSATSSDGLNWTLDNRVLIDHASVPSTIITTDGKIRVYYVDASQMPETTNCAESSDQGATFQVLNCTIANHTSEKALDPSIVRLPDGRYRLYYYAATGNPDTKDKHSIFSAISSDGVQFTQEQKVFEYPGLVDPDVFWSGKEWLMYVFSLDAGGTVIARSNDGSAFEYVGILGLKGWGTVAPIKLDDGRFRLYAFSQSRDKAIASFVSTDAMNWTREDGIKFTIPVGKEITDPLVVRLPNGTWKMIFKINDLPTLSELPPQSNRTSSAPTGGQPLPPRGTPPSQPNSSSERPCLPEKKRIAIQDPNGPSFHQVMLAKSNDGLAWQTDNRVLIDQASVPEGLRLSDGRWMIYAVDGSGLGGPGLVYAESKDEGKTWTCGKINLQGADPDVVVLPDGRIRLYSIEFPFGPNPPVPGFTQTNQPNRVKSAISTDGKTFTVEEGTRLEGAQYTDPDVIRIGNTWYMYISTGMTAYAAESSDGLNFKLIGKVNETGAVSGSFLFPDGTLRHYFCGRGGIMSATSTDGKSAWKEESGSRIAQSANIKIACDPSVLSDGKGGYWMAYKVQPK